MQTAIHFCSVLLEDNLQLKPISAWETPQDKVMFLVRADLPLQQAAVQLMAENKMVWQSPLRLVPSTGLVHPFSADDDESIAYMSSHFLVKTNLKIETVHYSVQVVDLLNETIINELPFTIEFFQPDEPVQEESLADTSAIDLILNNDVQAAVEVAVVTQAANVAVESVAVESVVNEENHFSNAVLASEEVVEEVVEESVLYTDTLSYDVQLVASLLAAANETDYSVVYQSAAEVAYRNCQIFIEKMGTKYIAVINDPAARPMFFLENGQFMKEWAGDFASYLAWLKDQLSLMFNILLEESNGWEIMLIGDDASAVDDARVTMVSRTKAVAALKGHSAILDVTDQGALLALHFVDGAQVTFTFNHLTTVERVQTVLAQWQQLLAGQHILPTGLLCEPSVLQGFSEQLQEASTYRRTSLAWELVMQLSK